MEESTTLDQRQGRSPPLLPFGGGKTNLPLKTQMFKEKVSSCY
jgi:hypothetical protein